MFQYKNILVLSVLVLVIKQSSQSPVGSVDEDDSSNMELNVDFKCITNPSCIKSVSNKLVKGLSQKQVMDFGAFVVEPVENAKNEGRSVSKFSDILANNALRVPFGGYSISLEKSQDYDNYLEVSISNAVEGRGRIGGSHGGGLRRGGKKQMQFFVPAFLVASQVGWWILALAGVSVLAIKAFLVSKLALVIGAVMTLKKLFEHHGLPPHYYEHPEPMMVPYNFDLSGFGTPSGFGNPSGFPSDFHSSLPLGHEAAALHQTGSLGAETNVITNITGAPSIANAPGLSAYATVARHPPVNFFGKNPFLYRKP